MSSLVPCSSCRRHVRRSDLACPFCAADLPSAAPALPAERAPLPPGTKRAALFAMGVTLAASACEPTNAIAIYGAPYVPEAGSGGNPAGNGGTGGNAGNAGLGGAGGREATDAAPPDAAADPPDADAPDADGADAADAAP